MKYILIAIIILYPTISDSKNYKWSGKARLKKIEDNLLPSYLIDNLDKFRNWLD